MITQEEMMERLCTKEKCGYCMTHSAPFTCCDSAKDIFLRANGEKWCKENIKHFDRKTGESAHLRYEQMTLF